MTEADAVHMAQHFLEQARRAKLHDEDQFQGAVLSLSGLLRRAAREAVTPALVPEPTPVETVPCHQSACFAGERREKRGLK